MHNKLFIAAATALLATGANAQMGKPEQSGWSGDIFAGVVSLNSKTLAEPGDDYNPSLLSFDDAAKSESRALPGALGNLYYTFENTDHQLFLGVSRSKVAEGQFAPEIGYRYWVGDDENITLAIVPTGIGGDAWADPYVLGAPRVETDRSLFGVRAKWEGVAGTGFGFEAATGKFEVDDELSGTALGLSDAQRASLVRDGDLNYVLAEYQIQAHRFLKLTPALYYYSKSDGGAASNFDATGIELGVQTGLSAKQIILLNLSYEMRDFDGVNPVFGMRNQIDGFKAFAAYFYREPFCWQNTAFSVIANYDKRDADIAFFDSKSSVLAVGLNYRF